MSELVSEGQRLVARFLSAGEEVRTAQQDQRRAEAELSNAEQALAKWLMPDDMKPGEKIAVWHGDSLFQVEMAPQTAHEVESGKPHVSYEPKVTVRTRGKHFSEFARRA